MSENISDSEERINRYPILKKRFRSLPDIVEDKSGNYGKAGEAESGLIEKLRQTGNELMNERASVRESAIYEESVRSSINITGHGKKNSDGRQLSERC